MYIKIINNMKKVNRNFKFWMIVYFFTITGILLILTFFPVDHIGNTTLLHNNQSVIISKSSISPLYMEKWNKTFGGTDEDKGYGIAIDNDKFIYLVGSTKNYGTGIPTYSNAMLVKFDITGNIKWYRIWGYSKKDIGYDVAIDNAHYVYIVGSTQNLAVSGRNLFVAKYDGNGNQIWNRTWKGSVLADIEGYAVAIDKNNNIYITGKTPGASFDMFIIKYNSSGSRIWNLTWGSTGEDMGKGIAVDSQDNIYVVGTYYDTGTSNDYIFLNKYSSGGVFQWSRKIGSSSYTDYGEGIAIDKNDYIFIVGSINNTATSSYDIVVAKYDSLGNLIWEKYYGDHKKEYGYDIAVGRFNNIYISGSKEASSPARNIFFLKIDGTGNMIFNTTWGGVGTADMYGYSIGVTSNLDVYIGGTLPSSGKIAILIKYKYFSYIPIITPGFQMPIILVSMAMVVITIIGYRITKVKSRKSRDILLS
ncbi:MAG: SBBP repeat-containing protein [Candidatus Helarchaeota archaeon]